MFSFKYAPILIGCSLLLPAIALIQWQIGIPVYIGYITLMSYGLIAVLILGANIDSK